MKAAKSKPQQPKPKVQETKTAQAGSVKKLSALMAILCAAFGIVLYAYTLGHNYAVDDGTVMENNKIVKQGISAIPEILTTPYRKGFWERKEGVYRPLSLVMFAIEWQAAPENPFPGHLMNILIYALTGFVLFITLRLMLVKYNLFVPFIATLLFIAHPLHTEVAANIKSRDELLNFLFLTLSLFFLFRFANDEKKKSALVWSAGCYLLALLSKESAVTWMAVIPLTLYFFTDYDTKKITKSSLFFLIPLAAYFALRFNALKGLEYDVEILPINNSLVATDDGMIRIATAIKILGKYLWLMLVPHPLVFDYSYNQIANVTFAHFGSMLSLLAYGALAAYAIATFKKKNIFSFCILYYFITISLVSNLVILIESVMAERFMFTPLLAYCIAIPVLMLRLLKVDPLRTSFHNWKSFFSVNKSAPAIMIVVLLLYSYKTISRSADWKNNLTLLGKDVLTSPESARIRYAYGSAILIEQALDEKDEQKKSAQLTEAIMHLEKGVGILATYSDAWYHLALAYKEKNDIPNAIRAFETAKQSKTWNDGEFYESSGLVYGLAKQYDKAFADFQKAVELNPESKEAFNNWGLYLTESGRTSEALIKLNKAIALDPQFESAWYNKGNTFAQAGDFRQAIACYEKAISLDPLYTDALNNMGNSYAAMNDVQNAIKTYERVLAIEPGNRKAITNLGVSYKILGDEQKSQQYFGMLGR